MVTGGKAYQKGKNIREEEREWGKSDDRGGKAWEENHGWEIDKEKKTMEDKELWNMFAGLPVDCASQWCSSAEPVLSSVLH